MIPVRLFRSVSGQRVASTNRYGSSHAAKEEADLNAHVLSNKSAQLA